MLKLVLFSQYHMKQPRMRDITIHFRWIYPAGALRGYRRGEGRGEEGRGGRGGRRQYHVYIFEDTVIYTCAPTNHPSFISAHSLCCWVFPVYLAVSTN